MTEEIIITGEFDIRGAVNSTGFKKPLTYCKIVIDYPSLVRCDTMISNKKEESKNE